ncbi:GGDEF domain-containing protein [Pseudomonas sp. DTU_2021_1001937_2_SI_NGA_ILE_001]|uniref:GGDEF domain-containing protein n=1 Tax=Pseudomonas sp. DTU_2021_1001937_2_SI_NGA_ILE_001 TaxID=3077589 RepID=UPI0028FC1AEA|nr:GGDEF domain-containing protein [Pseudomonas sp. DTU_2021_1001937_2_SI_NGA_ILE_001]WNW11074.1 GGDEF domain-containing protein [Pseudomonas sp. DTU_2021_1001937_2_SI_NGA_ILE_001]
MPTSGSVLQVRADQAVDLFSSETDALARARAVLAQADGEAGLYRQSLSELTGHFERLIRETRRLITRSDRAERDMNALNLQLQTLAEQLEFRATHDALTGVLNRGAVIERAKRLLESSGAVLIVLDIDLFKQINDDFGHPAGDAVICGIVECLTPIVAKAGVIGRVGGEEFTVVLPGDSLQQGLELAECMRQAIAAHGFAAPVNRQITASFGVSACPAGSRFDAAYSSADSALYRAKRGGRNRVEPAAD